MQHDARHERLAGPPTLVERGAAGVARAGGAPCAAGDRPRRDLDRTDGDVSKAISDEAREKQQVAAPRTGGRYRADVLVQTSTSSATRAGAAAGDHSRSVHHHGGPDLRARSAGAGPAMPHRHALPQLDATPSLRLHTSRGRQPPLTVESKRELYTYRGLRALVRTRRPASGPTRASTRAPRQQVPAARHPAPAMVRRIRDVRLLGDRTLEEPQISPTSRNPASGAQGNELTAATAMRGVDGLRCAGPAAEEEMDDASRG